MMNTNDELFDVVDEHDRVIGQATRNEVHSRGLLHRSSSIFLFNSRGELLLQERSATKDEFPHCWTSSASGHVDAGETYQFAAVRELREELGITASLEYLVTLPAGAQTANEHLALFRTDFDGSFVIDRDEIDSVEFVTIETAFSRIEQSPEQFTPPFRELFRWYWDHYHNVDKL